MGIAPLVQWQKVQWQNASKTRITSLLIPSLMILAVAGWVSLQAASGSSLFLLLGTAAALWLLVCLLLTILVASGLGRRVYACQSAPNDSPVKSSKQGFVAMLFAHFGVAITIIGATSVSFFEQEALLRMGPGQGKPLAGYVLVYESTENVETNSFTAIQANISIRDAANDERVLGYITPQRQTFKSNGMEMSHAGIDHGLWRDIYVSMGLQLSDNEYLIRISYKPLASWIWLGALLMMLGGAIAAWPTRRFSSQADLTTLFSLSHHKPKETLA
ncbi:cytochrome C biogenesis protein CcmF [Shewanella putrefaciens]|nr:cytochrome C biogenesis protein CcmF [Shewanella putrefaciens]